MCDLLHVEAAGRRILRRATEAVLERDGYRRRGCGALGRERSIIVHHRVPGVSRLDLMISLCPGCHAKVERTKMVLSEMTWLLLVLWREQHPEAQEQIMLGFDGLEPAAEGGSFPFNDVRSQDANRGD
jgi:hypothetical protein